MRLLLTTSILTAWAMTAGCEPSNPSPAMSGPNSKNDSDRSQCLPISRKGTAGGVSGVGAAQPDGGKESTDDGGCAQSDATDAGAGVD
jgi:hypothetical protein